MVKKHTNASITWVDMENPTMDEVRALVDEYGIDLAIAQSLHLASNTTYNDKLVKKSGYLYVAMHFPAFRHSHKHTDQEIDFIVGKNFLITTRYETIDAFERFIKNFEVHEILGQTARQDHAGFLFSVLLRQLYQSISDELDSINDVLKAIEQNIFKGKEKDMVVDISRVNRDLINLNHILLSHRDILKSLSQNDFFDADVLKEFGVILEEYSRIENILKGRIDTLHELRSTNDSLLSFKEGEIMKILTIMAFVTFPLTLISSLFSMNTKYTPIIGRPHDFLIIVIMMVVLVGIFFTFFKIKKWL